MFSCKKIRGHPTYHHAYLSLSVIVIIIKLITIIIGFALFNRLEWVRSFGITGKRGKPLAITTEPDTTPSMKELQDEFGIKIESYVEIIVGDEYEEFIAHMNSASQNNTKDNKKTTTTTPTSGDAICIDGKIPNSIGSLGIFVNKSEDKNLYATTCFHVLYNGEKLVDDDGNKLEFGERFNKQMVECKDPNSTTSSTSYCFRSKADKERAGEEGSYLGKYHAGTYCEKDDLGIVKVDEGVACNCDIPDIFEYRLTPRSVFGQMKARNLYPDVLKIGFKTGPTTGTLEQIDFCHKKAHVRDAYLVKVAEGMEAFMENGDSGSLVVWEDEKGKRWPFAYCVKEISSPYSHHTHQRCYVCFSLINSLEKCDANLQIKDNSD